MREKERIRKRTQNNPKQPSQRCGAWWGVGIRRVRRGGAVVWENDVHPLLVHLPRVPNPGVHPALEGPRITQRRKIGGVSDTEYKTSELRMRSSKRTCKSCACLCACVCVRVCACACVRVCVCVCVTGRRSRPDQSGAAMASQYPPDGKSRGRRW